MKSLVARAAIVALVCSIALAWAAPAMAAYGPVPSHAMAGSVDLFGMSEADARSAIAAQMPLPALPVLVVTVDGRPFPLDAASCVTLDIDAMLAQAYAPSAEPTITITRRCAVVAPVLDPYLNYVRASVNVPARDASYYIASNRLLWRPAIVGRALPISSSRTAIVAALQAEGLSGAAQPTVALATVAVNPKVTDATLGRAITVDVSSRKLRLFDHSSKIREYGVAVGMRGHATPVGNWRVVGKMVNPTWRNPGSDWADTMPASIKPGYYNPLGTRALYLSAPGIRIHGTSKLRSIGRAASHGCVRVANKNIEKLYPLVPVGTPVFIVP